MPLVLSGEATRPAGRRGQDDLPRLRLNGGFRRGLRRTLLALGGGLALYATHPPLDWGPAGYVALVPLLALAREVAADRRPVPAGLGWGLLAGMAYFLPLLTWIMRFGVLPWTLLAAAQATFVAAFVAAVAGWGLRRWRALAAVVAWVALEWLRSRVPLGGFPWGLLGYSQHDGGWLLGSARVVGVLGVGALLAGTAACMEELLARARWGGGWRAALVPMLSLAAIAAAAAVLAVDPPPATGRTVDIAGVQGNDVELPPLVDRGNVARVEDIAERMLAVTRQLGAGAGEPPAVTVWPENSLDADPRDSALLRRLVAEAQEALGGRTLLAGTLLAGPRPNTFRNAIVEYGPAASVADVYIKRILVPFGEYVPWRSILGDFPPLRAIPSDGIAGDEPHVFDVAGARIGPVTCYESIFPRLVRDQVRAGAQVLVVSTNNASFGRTPASRQHLAFSQLRAVETGRWTLHSGISGISAVVAPDGTVSQQTELFEQAVVRAELPLVDGWTPYVRFGDVVGPLAAVLAAGGLLMLLVDGRVRAATGAG